MLHVWTPKGHQQTTVLTTIFHLIIIIKSRLCEKKLWEFIDWYGCDIHRILFSVSFWMCKAPLCTSGVNTFHLTNMRHSISWLTSAVRMLIVNSAHQLIRETRHVMLEVCMTCILTHIVIGFITQCSLVGVQSFLYSAVCFTTAL